MLPILPVILSGGSGTRLWPLSREAYPKQFLPLVGDVTMLQATWNRVAAIAGKAPIVVANQEHRFMAAEQLRECNVTPQALILEPIGRNTAPAIAIAALQALATGEDALLLVLPSDHVVRDDAAFHAAVGQAAIAADAGKLVTFGIVPTAPETGYGYIKAQAGVGVRAVDRFVEKPDLATAQQYVASGEYYWNSGMFLFKASRYLEELEALQPAILSACRTALDKASRDTDFIRLDADAFAASPNDSIDYAVMEKTADAAVVPLDAGWNDVGSWSALWEVSDKDADGNACHGDVIALDCRNSYAYGTRLIAMVGLQDVVVVETDDAVFVGHKDRVQDVKEIVGQIKRDGRSEAAAHRKVYRPWGAYDSIDNGARFQVKRITVKPGATLSLQMHHHRAEHWIVVSGTAEVTRGDDVILLTENQSTYIPLGVTHRLKNPGKLPLELIEVQSGSYLGEDDIVRFEDQYGRS
ncbi:MULTISPECIES: mannose-1-phosphate guanylyltransferase/mannose-6-phosphate isomerase [Stenotrophomonas]|uniref:Xanthan biosynthesis protein XanB n=1 Tax=Stenotrophomonas rhizophila TaxID=216778 RepID=A0A498C8R8_9GAMM|nr:MULTISPECIES: mannose-1-phosphate guanylyltransferase/mannose-6-phosphate isomerase [Stenotrophomonas]MBU2049755.1 mannose-1-phosphate guanylyltransferase/mannose-6-phosphate isomerase [Gammaproteobacteria bacterium]RLK51913.1 mannose-1-phosphate guanylyltransferase (GDP) /mannose-6-phosphate isomerase type 2 [Stenotrophomonas rhizophila]